MRRHPRAAARGRGRVPGASTASTASPAWPGRKGARPGASGKAPRSVWPGMAVKVSTTRLDGPQGPRRTRKARETVGPLRREDRARGERGHRGERTYPPVNRNGSGLGLALELGRRSSRRIAGCV